jgi:predicted nucleotidyltransferase
MPYLNDVDINKRLHEHLLYYINTYNKDWFVLCLQGSQNYGVSDKESDIDSKLLVIPSLEDIVLNRKPVNHTLEMPDNQEHVDCKDVREYFKIFRKSNINFVEILFTDYYIVNNKYYDLWNRLRENAEGLARMNPYAAVSCMEGMAIQKRHALCHEYPSRMPWIEKFGYDPKQLSHLIRISYFLKWYIEGKLYKDCIYPEKKWLREWLLEWKRTGCGLNKEEAEAKADEVMENIITMADNFRKTCPNENDPITDSLLDEILYDLISRSLKEELDG